MHPFRGQPFIRPESDITHIMLMGIGVVFWVALIFGIILLFNRYTGRSGTHDTAAQDPIDIIKVRYAKGELSKEEFINLKKDLA